MGQKPGIRVLLVDDHEVVRTGVRRALETHPDIEVVGRPGVEVMRGRRDQWR